MEIKNGDIFIAADGGHYGHIVIDVEKYAFCDDVVVVQFTQSDGLEYDTIEERRIDRFKLAFVRYDKPDTIPQWVPQDVKDLSEKLHNEYNS